MSNAGVVLAFHAWTRMLIRRKKLVVSSTSLQKLVNSIFNMDGVASNECEISARDILRFHKT